MRPHQGDPEVFCAAMIGHQLTRQHDRAVHQPFQVLHVSATNTTIHHQNRDAPDNAESNNPANGNHSNANSIGHRPKTVSMTEQNNPPKSAGANDAAAGIPFYEKQRQHLKELIARKRALEKRLAAQEESIYNKETEYLENTPGGNVITGFDNYTKGTGTAAAARRKTGLTEANRVFSRSSISYNANSDSQTPASTPASHAPTPVSTSFGGREGANTSGAPTPTSATASGKASGASKKSKKTVAAAAAAASAGREDSETDSREGKKVRTNFGAVRK
ncbi:histone acetyltransferase subunit NuA4-domain-containing protein [Podospora aff. communis PSN243]|uniref:Chromatin modification-related protein EAF6 n=1 Tax=Podospora aff. communis PSN243 TaxID=3040156 RepID=A0AAV9GRH3_9PEZI|nr:histone acetyltransferase subunit NuA4-domain-containing protein [Podospora aff. communis PSN243]